MLLAPSIWPEAFGLVATEACARGIPCVSSANGGLVEANVLGRLRGFEGAQVETTLFHDRDESLIRRGVTMEGFESEWLQRHEGGEDAPPAPAEAESQEARLRKLLAMNSCVATEAEVQPYADIIARLMADDEYYGRASAAARGAGIDFIREHRGKFSALVDELKRE